MAVSVYRNIRRHELDHLSGVIIASLSLGNCARRTNGRGVRRGATRAQPLLHFARRAHRASRIL
jgi:hypothetical protein